MNTLDKQFQFIIEIDKLKNIIRHNSLADGSRRENSAEHSWHLVMIAIVLEPYSEGADILKIIKMLAIHDIVEVDAGDVYIHDKEAMKGKEEREQKAANRLFMMIPEGEILRSLWQEFEDATTKEAKFAKMIDRIHPFLLHVASEGKIWLQDKIKKEQVLEVMKPVKEFPLMWEYLESQLEKASNNNWLL